MSTKNKLVIGLSGTICSGKGLVAEILRSKGCQVDTLSSIIRDELKSKGLEPTRKTLQDGGNRLRKEFGGQVLAERLLAKYKSYDVPLVIDGLRNMAEIDYLKKHSRFFLVGVDAPFEVRWTRVQKRNRDSDLLNYDKFVIDDARDRGFNEPLNGQQVGMCLVHADFLVNNDEEYKRLEDSKVYKQVNDIYREIMKKK
jgi:dephospho-CoA kinase